MLKISEISANLVLSFAATRASKASLISTGDLSSCSLKSFVQISPNKSYGADGASLNSRNGADAARAP